MQCTGKEWRHCWVLSLLLIGIVGYGLACTPLGLRYRPLNVTYLPYLVKGQPDHLPRHRMLVLFPLDKRRELPVKEGEVPPVVMGASILSARQPKPAGGVLPEAFYPVVGFLGTNSRGRLFLRSPSSFSPPDRPRLLFYLQDLQGTVQQALATHLSEAEFPVTVAPFSHPQDRAPDEESEANYAVGCAIEECALLSLLYYVQARSSGDFYPVLGPTWAHVALTLTLYRWPSGTQLWEGRVSARLSDPAPGEDMRIYGSMGEVLSVALSRAVGSFLITRAVQDILTQSSDAPEESMFFFNKLRAKG